MLNLTNIILTQTETSYNANKMYFDHPAGLDIALWNLFWKEMYKTESKPVRFLTKKIIGFTNIPSGVKIQVI